VVGWHAGGMRGGEIGGGWGDHRKWGAGGEGIVHGREEKGEDLGSHHGWILTHK
jgi:hypothetical protein